MSTFIQIAVNIDGDAFTDRLEDELRHVLDANRIVNGLAEASGRRIVLTDSSGRACGNARLTSVESFFPDHPRRDT